jgi:hypothetical protein
LKRAAAASSIQRIWRKYVAKKKLKTYKKIIENRAAIRIQSWIRNLSYYHRNKFLKMILWDLKEQVTSRLNIH